LLDKETEETYETDETEDFKKGAPHELVARAPGVRSLFVGSARIIDKHVSISDEPTERCDENVQQGIARVVYTDTGDGGAGTSCSSQSNKSYDCEIQDNPVHYQVSPLSIHI